MMNNKRLLVFTVVTTLLLVNVTYAADSDRIDTSLTNIKLFLNGNQIDEEIIVVDGSPYLPFKAISEALGLDVKWNGDTNTISLTSTINGDDAIMNKTLEMLQSKNDELEDKIKTLESGLDDKIVNESEAKWITKKDDKNALAINEWSNGSSFQINGEKFDSGLGVSGWTYNKLNDWLNSGSAYSYVPNGGYTKLVGEIGLDDIGGDNAWARVRITGYLESKSVTKIIKRVDYHILHKGANPFQFEYNIEGCNKIVICFYSSIEEVNGAKPVLVNAKFIKEE